MNIKNEKSSESMVDICDRVSKISLYALIVLLPLLFLPWTANVLEFNKQAALIVLAFVSFFAWLLKVLISGKTKINVSLAYLPIVLTLVVYLLSTVFSLWKYGSFWGWPKVTSESMASVIGLSLVYILVINIFEKKDFFYLALTLVFSGMAAMAYGILQMLGLFIMPIGFTKSVSFNTIGGITSLGIFASVLIPLSMVLLIASKKNLFRIILGAAILLEASVLLLVNVQVAWWLALIASALVFAFAMQRRDLFDGRWLIMPMFFLALALLFAFFKFGIPGLPNRPVEIFLKQKPSLDLTLKSLRTSPVFGTGPGTFNNVFLKYKDLSFNKGDFWSVNFDWGGSKALTILATVGISGALAFLFFIGYFIYFGINYLFRKKSADESGWNLGAGLFITFLVLSISYFIYSSTLTLDFVYFLVIALLVGLFMPAKKEFALKSSSLLTLIFTFSVTVVFVFGLGILILEGQRYVSAASYLAGIKDWQNGKTDSALGELDQAAVISPAVDLYWREIATANLQNANLAAGSQTLSQDEKSKAIQLSINKSVNAAKNATDVNPKDSANWALRGSIYQGFIGVVQGTEQWSLDAYKEAIKLEPNNPDYPTQAGISVLKQISILTKDQESQKPDLYKQAKEFFDQAISLKSDYAPAHYQMAQLYINQNDVQNAVLSLQLAAAAAPTDVNLAFQLGLVYYNQAKDYGKAAAEFETAVSLNPNYSNALYFLGLCYDELGRKSDAVTVFERVTQLNPKNDLAASILTNLKAGKKALDGISQ